MCVYIVYRFSMTAAAGVLTGLAKLKRQDSARSQLRPGQPTSPGGGNPVPEAAPRCSSQADIHRFNVNDKRPVIVNKLKRVFVTLFCASYCSWQALHYISLNLSLHGVFFHFYPSRKRKRRTDVVVVRGRLRLYSASGFFLLLGLVILAIGICMATLGYWPHRETTHSAKSADWRRIKDRSSWRRQVIFHRWRRWSQDVRHREGWGFVQQESWCAREGKNHLIIICFLPHSIRGYVTKKLKFTHFPPWPMDTLVWINRNDHKFLFPLPLNGPFIFKYFIFTSVAWSSLRRQTCFLQ